MKKYFFFVLVVLPVFFSADFHPIYVSTTQVEYNESNKSLDIAIKVFSDDLESAISKSEGSLVEIGTEKEALNATELIVGYVKKNFSLEVNGKEVEYKFISRKLEKKDFFAMWILVQVEKVRKLKSMKITNNLLIDLNYQQQNIISFRDSDGSKKKFTTYRNKTEVVIK
jgi:hypothetical protein